MGIRDEAGPGAGVPPSPGLEEPPVIAGTGPAPAPLPQARRSRGPRRGLLLGVWTGAAVAGVVAGVLLTWRQLALPRSRPVGVENITSPPEPAPIRATDPAVAAPDAPRPDEPAPAPAPGGLDAPVLATCLVTVADDFIVDLFHNAAKVPDAQRRLVSEVFGATAERIEVPVREGDWLVFNVVNNRLRWGGVCYFAVAGLTPDGAVAFMTESQSGQWSCCDDPADVPRFIARRDYLADNSVRPIEQPWAQGDRLIRQTVKTWQGEPVWGTNRNTWIKFVARPASPPR